MGILEGRVAIVTGAGQGSGRGVSIAVVGRTESKLISVAEEIRARGGDALPIRCDVAETAQIDAAVEATVSQFGRVDVLAQAAHHNSRRADLLDVSDED